MHIARRRHDVHWQRDEKGNKGGMTTAHRLAREPTDVLVCPCPWPRGGKPRSEESRPSAPEQRPSPIRHRSPLTHTVNALPLSKQVKSTHSPAPSVAATILSPPSPGACTTALGQCRVRPRGVPWRASDVCDVGTCCRHHPHLHLPESYPSTGMLSASTASVLWHGGTWRPAPGPNRP